ncbi:MAG: right-handed parallel beta-helix repeat-containing protein [Thermoguttaceae bacterium]
MAIYQRTTEPVFTVSNIKPGTTTDFRVTAYDSKGTVLNALSFTYAPVDLAAPDYFGSNAAISVEILDAQSATADLAWYYVTPDGDVAIPEAANQTSFAPANLDYPVKIVATGTGISAGSVAEALVNPAELNVAHTAPYVTPSRQFDATWDAVPDAARYVFQRKNAAGNWATMTGSDVVDGAVVSGNVRTTDGSAFEYTVHMSDASVAKEYRVLALNAKGALIVSETFEYTPMGLVVDNDAYPLDKASTLVASPLDAADAPTYQWYSASADSPEDWPLIEGETGSTYQLTSESAALGLYYKVVATDPAADDRISVSYARPDTIDAPSNLVVTVDETTGDLVATWNASGATDFVLQYAYEGPAVDAWLDLPAPTVTDNGDGSFTLTHPNGVKYENLRVRAVNETGWSNFKVAGSDEPIPVEDSPFRVNTLLDVVDANDGVTSLREAVSYYLDAQEAGTLPDEAKVVFDPNVFTAENHTIVLDAETSFNLSAPLVVDATNLDVNVVLDATASTNRLFTLTGEDADVTLAGLTVANASQTSKSGGALYVASGATLTLSSFKITESEARFGGGVYVNNATLIIENSTFDNNYSVVSGGVISAANYANIVVSNTTFENNVAKSMGGAVHLVSGSTATFTNCAFLENSTNTHGAAVYLAHASATFVGGEISRNAAGSTDGEAVFVSDVSTADFTDVAFDSNTPSDIGGDGTVTTTTTASSALLELDADLLDEVFVELEEEIELFF